MKKQTQNAKVLKRLATHGCITSMDAIYRYSITRLAARINNLREAGWDIKTQMDSKTDFDGNTDRFARYWLSEKQIRKARKAVGVV